jgi:hypothetical protein
MNHPKTATETVDGACPPQQRGAAALQHDQPPAATTEPPNQMDMLSSRRPAGVDHRMKHTFNEMRQTPAPGRGEASAARGTSAVSAAPAIDRGGPTRTTYST